MHTDLKGSPKKVLVVEDEKPLARALQLKLTSVGHEVDVAYDGEEALKFTKEKAYDFMILDLVMPVLTGFGVLEQLQGGSNKPKEIIVLSNLSQVEDKQKVTALGVKPENFLTKSATPLSQIVDLIGK